MSLVWLWTDVCLWGMAIGLVFGIRHLRQHPILKQRWHQLLQQPAAMMSAMLCAFFFTVALMDSVHIMDSHKDVYSLLDKAISPLQNGWETSYSSPLALYSHSTEKIWQEGQGWQQTYERLEHAGQHLTADIEKQQDLMTRFAGALLLSIAGAWLIKRLVCAPLNHQPCTKAQRALLFSVGLLIFIVAVIVLVGFHYHLLGTGKVGEDVLYQCLKSIRTAFIMGTMTTVFIIPLAVMLGVMAGYFRGTVDGVIQYIYTTISAIPGVLLIAAGALSLQVWMQNHDDYFVSEIQRSDIQLLMLCVVLGMTSWCGLCRLIRAEVLKISTLDFIAAAKIQGLSSLTILRRHFLPNLMHMIWLALALDFSGFVLAESVLSYIGVGVDANTYSFGSLINASRSELSRTPVIWWSIVGSFVVMVSLVLSVNVLADAIRDVFDPKYSKEST